MRRLLLCAERTVPAVLARWICQSTGSVGLDNTPNIFELKHELKKFIGNRFQRKVDIAREKYLKQTCKERILKEAFYVGEEDREP